MPANAMGLGDWAQRATEIGQPAGAAPATPPAQPGSAAGAGEQPEGAAAVAAPGSLSPEQLDALWQWVLANKPEYAKALLDLANAADALKGFNPEFDPGAGSYVAEEMATGKYPPEQAIAVGLSRAREAGLKVPEA